VLLAFELSMPNVGSWNGRWSGEGSYYAKVINFTQRFRKSQKAEQLARDILSNHSYYYNFGDGWGMSISVKEVNSKEATVIRKKSKGFCGYDWAIESIIRHKKIISD